MQPIKYGKYAVFMVLMLIQVSFSVEYTVSKDGTANFTSIQTAIDNAQPGDIITIMDTEVYAEQVTIDSTVSDLILRSKDPDNLVKPTIKYCDKTNVGPRNADEALDDSKINFDQNGALRVLASSNILIQGIAVDGGGIAPFGYDAVWEGRYALQHGNAAITLWVAGQVIIQDCDIKNAYIGINVKDRNEGGVFANPNPADINPENIIPFSGFAQTGNHVIEYNRIHDNSLGFFFESTWDMGSTVRYNLIYENHHPTTAIANQVKSLTSEGGNQAGGAFMFKDQLLSPLAIYNNTLWHNSIPFLGNWKSGGQHLIFNNIIAEPDQYFNNSTTTFSTNFEMSKTFVNRMHNTVWAAQQQEPLATFTTITNDLRPAQTGGSYVEGSLISPFPASAEVRWVETKFLSTDPTSLDFLTPDWGDDLVQEYIVDKGWAASGVKDPNGTPADLGAIPMEGGRPVDLATMRLKMPIRITGNSATINFELSERIGEMTDPKVVMFGVVTHLDTSDVFGADYTPIAATNIRTVQLGTQTVKVGENSLTVTLPATGDFAFIEMIIEGTGQNGLPFTSAVGFFPYRDFKYLIEVEVLDKVGGTVLTEVQAGQAVVLHVKTFNGTVPFTNTIVEANTDVGLQTLGLELLDPNGDTVRVITGGITNGEGNADVMFTRVPPSGEEMVRVTALWVDPSNPSNKLTFMGISDGIKIKAGPPDSIVITKPTQFGDVIEMMTAYVVNAQVYDKYGNRVDVAVNATCTSLQPDIGDITEKTVATDITGQARFVASVTDGAPKDTFYIVASLESKPTATDTAFLIVGEPRDKIYIFYGDTLAYDETAIIDECSGVKVPITIRASANGKDPVATRNTTLTLTLTPSDQLKAFATPTSTDPITATQLVNGQVVIYVQGTGKSVSNGTINVVSTDPSLISGDRSGINFKECFKLVEGGAYFADNGRGAVDRAEIWYASPLDATEVPDSVRLCWPSEGTGCRTFFKIGGGIVQDPNDPSHIIITVSPPFAEGVTKINGASSSLGMVFWVNPNTPTAPSINQNVAMRDSVGPLIASAVLIERLAAGDDNMIVTFTEPVDYQKLPGQTLTLVKGDQHLQLTIKDARPGDNQAVIVTVDNGLSAGAPMAGDSLMITAAGTVSDANGNKAHPQNRPVVIQLQAVAPSLVSAYYLDVNGDGVVETVRATFNKPVELTNARITVNFAGQEGNGGIAAEKITFVTDGGNAILDLQIDQLFSRSFLQDRTSGAMLITAEFFDFPDGENKSSVTADDKAGPVLTALEYHFGMIQDANANPDPDTIFAKYSEQLSAPPAAGIPFKFITSTGTPYEITVLLSVGYVGAGDMTGYYQFTVDPSTLPLTPEGGTKGANNIVRNPKDSAWINIAEAATNAVDALSNAQKVETNKKVAIVIKKPPFKLDVSYGPNPMIGVASPFNVTAKAKTKEAEQTTFEYNFFIFDKVGNPIYRFPENGTVTVKDSIVIKWNGVNEAGRMVGNGTYLAKLFVRYWNTLTPEDVFLHSQNIKIGVKRTQ
ncbi:MAG: hypothetical protein JW863_12215 [Chitinispirillaceae bacterium]|nr:hypothetical protein [Chitinispirillaceae bacterium]